MKGTSVAKPITIRAEISNFTQGLAKQCKSAEIVPRVFGTGAAAVILMIGIFATPDIFLQLETIGLGSHLGLGASCCGGFACLGGLHAETRP